MTAGKLLRQLKSGQLWRKGWRWLRDRRRYADGGEAKFFFGRESRNSTAGPHGRGAAPSIIPTWSRWPTGFGRT